MNGGRCRIRLKRFIVVNRSYVVILFLVVIVFNYFYRSHDNVDVEDIAMRSTDLDKYIIGDIKHIFKPEVGHVEHRTASDLKCNQPKLDPYHASMNKYFYSIPKLECGNEKDWVYVVNGTLYLSNLVKEQNGKITCDSTSIIRVDDFSNKDGETIKSFPNATLMKSDFVRVDCSDAHGNTYSKVLSGIAYNHSHHRRENIDVSSNAMDLNVLMFGFDSVSRMTAIRKYVKTRSYILNELKGFELEGYNIVGDGTPQAIIPIITGQTEEDLPEARRGIEGAKPVDGHPFIWKDFKRAGYATLYAEDAPKIGIFQDRMLGFIDQPTDHYMRPYYLASEFRHEQWFKFVRDYLNSISNIFSGQKVVDPAFCYGSKPKHQIFLEYLGAAFDMYPTKRKFLFGFHAEITHENNNMIDYIDEDVAAFIKRLETNGHLNQTLLIFMSDHGARFENFRQTVQGKLEERMPFFTFRFPPWFEKVYPEAISNFKLNTQRLTAPFDIYATLKHMLHYTTGEKGEVSQRGISLFKEIPKERSCDHAGIEPHWCACLDWKDVDLSDPVLKRAILAAITTINGVMKNYWKYCHFLRISQITRAKKYFANSDVLRFKQSADHDGRVADLSSKTKNSEIFYQLTLITEPGNGHFEITVRHILDSNKVISNVKDVSRTNVYGTAPDCIANKFPHLNRFCYCK